MPQIKFELPVVDTRPREQMRQIVITICHQFRDQIVKQLIDLANETERPFNEAAHWSSRVGLYPLKQKAEAIRNLTPVIQMIEPNV